MWTLSLETGHQLFFTACMQGSLSLLFPRWSQALHWRRAKPWGQGGGRTDREPPLRRARKRVARFAIGGGDAATLLGNKSPEVYIWKIWNSYLPKHNSLFSPSHKSLAITILLRLSVNLSSLCLFCKWNAIYIFLWLTFHFAWYPQSSSYCIL